MDAQSRTDPARQGYVPSLGLAKVRILFATLGAMVMAAAPAAAAPIPSYTASPDPPQAGLPGGTTFTSTSTPDPGWTITSVGWDFAGGTGFEQGGTTTTFPYGSCGPRTFRMRVVETDPLTLQTATSISTFNVTVVPRPTNQTPIAQFSFAPISPVLGQEVLFLSQVFDPDGPRTRFTWDFDGDGFDDGSAAAVARRYTTVGAKTVRLLATDSCASSIASETFDVVSSPSNRLPVAQFAVSPLRPRVGEQVSLRSFSYDADGSIVSQRWDLDGDGDFDENVTGQTAFTVFPKAGERIVRLEVRDSSGGVQTETQNITVRRASSRGLLINPFPVARLAGSVFPRGVRVRILEVSTPRRSRVVLRCDGRSCPAEKIVKVARRKPVRFKAMTRFLRAGTVLELSIRKSGQIGKYVRWRIRGGKLPKRKDLCLYPRQRKPRRCPTS
jgi:PKD repeat protein